MIQLKVHPQGIVLPVKAQPSARVNEIRGEQEGQLKVAVTQAPEKGKANKAIIEVLSKGLKLPRSQFELLSGETSSQKLFLVRETSVDELQQAIQHVLDSRSE